MKEAILYSILTKCFENRRAKPPSEYREKEERNMLTFPIYHICMRKRRKRSCMAVCGFHWYTPAFFYEKAPACKFLQAGAQRPIL